MKKSIYDLSPVEMRIYRIAYLISRFVILLDLYRQQEYKRYTIPPKKFFNTNKTLPISGLSSKWNYSCFSGILQSRYITPAVFNDSPTARAHHN